MSTTYTHAHRTLLQSFLSRTTHTAATLRPLLARILSIEEKRPILENDITDPDIASHIAVINAAISEYDLAIRSQLTQWGHQTDYTEDGDESEEERTKVRVYALVNTTQDAISQVATTHTPDEIAFLLRLLDAMFETNNTPTGGYGREICAVSHMAALQLHRPPRDAQRRGSGVDGETSTAKALSMQEAERLLAELVSEGWLEILSAPNERNSKYYVLSPRALMELKGWLVDTYNEPPSDSAPASGEEDESGSERIRGRGVERIKMCAACAEIVISGQRCGERRCGGRLHNACLGSFWRSRRGQRTCPECEREWSGVDFVGVRAVAGTGRQSAGGGRVNGVRASDMRSSNVSRKADERRRSETTEADGADDDVEMSE